LFRVTLAVLLRKLLIRLGNDRILISDLACCNARWRMEALSMWRMRKGLLEWALCRLGFI